MAHPHLAYSHKERRFHRERDEVVHLRAVARKNAEEDAKTIDAKFTVVEPKALPAPEEK